jgi:hypothetical protein
MDTANDQLWSLPLAPTPGYQSFAVAGSIAGRPVQAAWDGRSLRLHPALFRRALLAVAVDDVVAHTDLGSIGRRSTISGPVPDVVLTLARSCDVVDAAEYRYRGQRRRFVSLPPDTVVVVGLDPD